MKAEKTLNGIANPIGVKFCKPFSTSNAFGWWLFSPVDIDICWRGGQNFEHKLLEEWPSTEHILSKSLAQNRPDIDSSQFCPSQGGRSKFTWGEVEPAVVQIWTGCIFETPPGYNLQIRSPINFPNREFRVMEGILETDWLQYDIWINLVFEVQDKWVRLRKNEFPPLAQIVPVKREAYERDWKIGTNQMVNRGSSEANKVADFWLDYNHRKYCLGGKQRLTDDRNKDATTYYKIRAEMMGKNQGALEPIKTNETGCPFIGKFVPQ